MAVVTFREPELNFLLNAPGGNVGRYLRRQMNEILTLARGIAGQDTGQLRRSLKVISHNRYARGQLIEGGSKLSYALMHHEGTSPHIIRASGGRMMRFTSNGQVHYAKRVVHPGTRGRKYLTIPLNRVI